MNQIENVIRSSDLFDSDWYCARYPDVLTVGLDPVVHFVTVGARLGRSPGPNFDSAKYLNVHSDVAQAGINPLFHYIKWGKNEGRRIEPVSSGPRIPNRSLTGAPITEVAQSMGLNHDAPQVIGINGPNLASRETQAIVPTNQTKSDLPKITTRDVDRFKSKLFGGYSRYAIPELESWKSAHHLAKSVRSTAAWHLARWFFVEGDYQRSLENCIFVRILRAGLRVEAMLLEIQCLIKLERYGEASYWTEEGLKKTDKFSDLLMLKATISRKSLLAKGCPIDKVDSEQLAVLNDVFVRGELTPLEIVDITKPLDFFNIRSKAVSTRTNFPYKVTIVIPSYNAEATIHIPLDSLTTQTWKNIEIIVVDDLSSDKTCKIVTKYATRDDRVKLIRKSRNSGAYGSRNLGLKHATGDYIMVHDSDDWSHPQKIEIQLDQLLSKQECVAVMSHWIRVDSQLEVVGPWLPKGSLYDLNFSSLLFRRDVLDKLGGWDSARVSGDAEFRTRMMKVYGDTSICIVPNTLPLSFALSREDSLTRSKATHLKSLMFGVRWQYRDAYNYWHTSDSALLKADIEEGSSNKFPIPLGNTHRKGTEQRYDIVFVCDFALMGGAFVSTLNYMTAACEAGLKVAAIHWRKYELGALSPINPRLYEACVEHDIDILTHGDTAKTEFVIVGYPAILHHLQDKFPTIGTKHLIVIVNQFASRLVDGGDQQYDPWVARANLRTLFGKEGVWIPISQLVADLMKQDGRYSRPYTKSWSPMINVNAWCSAPLRWRGDSGGVPKVGRHGRDAYTKWPTNPRDISLAYGVERPVELRFLGGADCALQLLDSKPSNWSVLPFNSVSVLEFLQDLDFYVHYPHEDYIEEFGRAVMEAMAAGIPVILPEQFRSTFGDAAVYASPAEVVPKILALWSTKTSYIAQATLGRDFVLQNCDSSKFKARLEQFKRARSRLKLKNSTEAESAKS